MSENALITGGCGFIGSHLAEKLVAEGWEVHTSSRNPRDEKGSEIIRHVCDFSDLDEAENLVAEVRPTLIFHLAGTVSASPEMDLVLPTFHSHVTSAINLMTLVPEFKVKRLILAGSLTESTGGAAYSPYGTAKTVVRAYAKMFKRLYSTPVVLVRPFMTFGPRQHESKVLPYVIRALANGETPKIGSGDGRADWIYVSDVVEGFWKAAIVPGIDGGQFDLGRGELLSLRFMVNRIAELMKSSIVPEFGARPDRPGETEKQANILETQAKLGWGAVVDIDSALTRTIHSYADSH